MSVVPDASVALKWFFLEQGREDARALFSGIEPLIAPDLIIPEVLNGAWKAVRHGFVPAAQVENIPNILPTCFATLARSSDLAQRALEIAIALDHPVYDCFYLALAETERTVVITADDRLLRKTRKSSFAGLVRAL
jgi:predicted nucleic acid-binding protein